MNSVFFRPTGRIIQHRSELAKLSSHEIVRNNEVFVAEPLQDTRGKSLYKRFSDTELDVRLNATGDVADAATGYQIATDTLTYISKQVSEQKFYTVPFAEFMPVMVGEGAYSQSLLFNRSYSTAEDFESGIIDQANADARLSNAETAIDGITQKTHFWAKQINYTIIEIQQALLANSWDPVMGKMSARKQNWDLGLQIIAFLGMATDANFPGLLTNTAFTVDTSSTIPKAIRTMSATEFATFLGAFLQSYITNVGSTAMPDTFLMPQSDYIGCAQTMVQNLISGGTGTYVGRSILDYLTDVLRIATGNPNFQIKSLYYGDKAVNNTARGLNLNYYALYRRDPLSIRLNVPIDYTVLQAGTINNFQFQAAAFGQFTGLVSLRNLECVIYTNTT